MMFSLLGQKKDDKKNLKFKKMCITASILKPTYDQKSDTFFGGPKQFMCKIVLETCKML